MANGMMNGNGPAWLNTLLKLGVPSAIAVYLVYMLASAIPTLLTNTSPERWEKQLHAQEQRLLSAISEAHARELKEHRYILEQICRNTAKTRAAEEQCDPDPRR